MATSSLSILCFWQLLHSDFDFLVLIRLEFHTGRMHTLDCRLVKHIGQSKMKESEEENARRADA